jgi:hypothetical protein
MYVIFSFPKYFDQNYHKPVSCPPSWISADVSLTGYAMVIMSQNYTSAAISNIKLTKNILGICQWTICILD